MTKSLEELTESTNQDLFSITWEMTAVASLYSEATAGSGPSYFLNNPGQRLEA